MIWVLIFPLRYWFFDRLLLNNAFKVIDLFLKLLSRTHFLHINDIFAWNSIIYIPVFAIIDLYLKILLNLILKVNNWLIRLILYDIGHIFLNGAIRLLNFHLTFFELILLQILDETFLKTCRRWVDRAQFWAGHKFAESFLRLS